MGVVRPAPCVRPPPRQQPISHHGKKDRHQRFTTARVARQVNEFADWNDAPIAAPFFTTAAAQGGRAPFANLGRSALRIAPISQRRARRSLPPPIHILAEVATQPWQLVLAVKPPGPGAGPGRPGRHPQRQHRRSAPERDRQVGQAHRRSDEEGRAGERRGPQGGRLQPLRLRRVELLRRHHLARPAQHRGVVGGGDQLAAAAGEVLFQHLQVRQPPRVALGGNARRDVGHPAGRSGSAPPLPPRPAPCPASAPPRRRPCPGRPPPRRRACAGPGRDSPACEPAGPRASS